MCFHRFSAFWEASGAQKPYVVTGVLPPGKSWVLKKHMFSQVFCLLTNLGNSKIICFHRCFVSWGGLGVVKSYVFIGFLLPGKFWGLKHHVFSQVVCLLGKTARGRKTGTCGGSKHICFHSRPGRRPSAREAALQVRSQNIRPCGWGWFQTCSLSLQFYFSRSLAFSFYPSQSVCVCVSLSLSLSRFV